MGPKGSYGMIIGVIKLANTFDQFRNEEDVRAIEYRRKCFEKAHHA